MDNQFFVPLNLNNNPLKNALGEKVSMSMKVLSSDFSSTNLIKTSEWVIPAGALVTSVTWKPVSTPTSGANNLAIGLQTDSGSLTLVSDNKIWLGDSDQTSMFPIDCYVPNNSTLMLSVDDQFYLADIEGLIVVEYALNIEYDALNADQSKKNVHMDLDGLTSGESFGCGYRALNQARFPVFSRHPWTAGTNQDKYGYFYYNSTNKKLYIYDSTYTWVTWTGGGAQDDCYHYSQYLTGTNCFSDWNNLETAWTNAPKPIVIDDFPNGSTDLTITLRGTVDTSLRIAVNPALLAIDLIFTNGGVVELYGGDFSRITASAAIFNLVANNVYRLNLTLDNDYNNIWDSYVFVNGYLYTLVIDNCQSLSDLIIHADVFEQISAHSCNVRRLYLVGRVWRQTDGGEQVISKSINTALANALNALEKPDVVIDIKNIFIEVSNLLIERCYAVIHNASIVCRNDCNISVACFKVNKEGDWGILRLKNCDSRNDSAITPIYALQVDGALISEYSVYKTNGAEPIVNNGAGALYNYQSRANNNISFAPLCDRWTVYAEVL